MAKAHFDIHASIVFQLGEQLITDAVQAVVELVKNSFDADASYCSLDVATKSKAGKNSRLYENCQGCIVISDDGIGMTPEIIEKGFLIISNSAKKEMKRKKLKTKKGRTPLGDKGLGRLSAQRLAKNVEIFTTPDGSGTEYYVGFSWDDFYNQERLTQVTVTTDHWKTTKGRGTKVVLSGLREPETWTGEALDNLTRDLSSMISPYKGVSDFKLVATIDGVKLDLQEFAEKLRDTAQLRYKLDFDGKTLSCSGKARLDYIYPEKAEDKKLYQKIVSKDDGEGFFEFLLTQKAAERFSIKRSKQDGWFIEYSENYAFSEMDKRKRASKEDFNPGPFRGEIDGFDLGARSASKAGIVNSIRDYRQAVKNITGIRVYRDGFGVRVDEDWLGLGKQLTGAISYYTLRPDNTVGFIAISAADNEQLEETTDREGFRTTPYYENFVVILRQFVEFSAAAQNFIRRSWNKFREKYEKESLGYEEDIEPQTIKQRALSKLTKAEEISGTLKSAKAAVTKAASSSSRSSMKRQLQAVTNALELSEKEVFDVQSVKGDVSYLENQIELLQGQMVELYEMVSLGLTAEVLSHEMRNVSDQLALRNLNASKHMKEKQIKDAVLLTHLEFINSSVSAIRKQVSHLAPSLKYVREKKENILQSTFCEELTSFYKDRLEKAGIKVSIKVAKDFTVRMNRGKLNQVLDNILLNSDYWLKEDIRTEKIKTGLIEIEIAKPFLRVSDNGRGFDKSIEATAFEPFISRKAKGVGRGLGLFIVSQLLDAEGCTVELLSKRNKVGNRYVLEINFTGALNG